jgi:NAD(P)-dependent dehydrogenase (short-subunit alcohol dehydrogenase family)
MATVLITGANRGIGLELCRQMKARGDQVIAACRTPSPALEALGVRVEPGVDVGSDEAVAALDQRLGDTKLDILINNAGILTLESLDDLDFDRIRRQFEINSLGPLRVSAALRHRLGSGSKVIIITSRMGSIGDNTSGSGYGYRMSKAAVNMAGVSLAHDLGPRGVAVAILHPGMVRTDMTGHHALIDPPESVAGLLARIDELTMETSGWFWHANGERLPW